MNRTLQAVLVIGTIDLIARGTDYLLGSPVSSTSLYYMQSMPIAWGIACLVSALILAVGVTWRKFQVAIIGSLSAFGVYALLGFTVLDSTILTANPDDWRVLSDHWAKAAMFLVLAISLAFRHGVLKILNARKEKRDRLQ